MINSRALAAEKDIYAKKGPESVIFNPFYIEEPAGSQRYKSLAGQRTTFIDFHVYMFSQSDEHIKLMQKGFKSFYAEQELSKSDSVFLDVDMLKAAIDYQLAIRADGVWEVFELSKDILDSWKHDLMLSEEYEDVTSESLIELAENVKQRANFVDN